MLEVRNLTKVYSGKKGVSVRALDDVSVVFPEKGMVFLLGKSGSGKSTLLNLAGGLDKPDSGEIIVKGKSSKVFSGSDFDSYRNTFIGFVFQEYNILNEFTIEQNIALALQLQNKPNNREAVNALLEQVDLAGYGKRKPNTLSGGQKQRVAIARALIKEPEIIMADEPTGALDSATGKQVFDTLKKLSETKLVIVVSHDREFAEQYGDRIIELKDGKILSDVSKVYNEVTNKTENVSMISEDTISVKRGEAITEEDVRKIVRLLRQNGGEAIITANKRELPDVKRACKINENGSKESFADTKEVEIAEYDGSKTKFIKSRLPLGHAIKMGASGLKSKPIRLIFTIILAVAAFILFGVASTFMLYDSAYSVSEAMKEADYPAMTLSKNYERTNRYDYVDATGKRLSGSDYTENITTRFGASEVAAKSKDGLVFAGVFDFTDYDRMNEADIELKLVKGETVYPVKIKDELKQYYNFHTAVGYCDCGAEYLSDRGFTLVAGAYPQNKTEIALTEYLAALFVNSDEMEVASPQELIGKKIKFSTSALREEVFTIAGIYRVGEISSEYDVLKTGLGAMNDYDKQRFFEGYHDYLANSYHRLVFVSSDFYVAYQEGIEHSSGSYYSIWSELYKDIQLSLYPFGTKLMDEGSSMSVFDETTLTVYGNVFTFYDLNGEEVGATPAAGRAYINYNDYKYALRSKLSNLYGALVYYPERYRYVPDAVTEYTSEAFQEALANSANEYDAMLGFVTKWFQQVVYREYLFRAAEDLYKTGEAPYSEAPFATAYETLRDYFDNYNQEVTPTESDWNTIREVVEANYATRFPQRRYYIVRDILRNQIGYSDDLIPDEYLLLNDLQNGDLSEEDFTAYKKVLEDFMTAKGIALITDQKPFALSEKAYKLDAMSLYYSDLNATGSIEVGGYYVPKTDGYMYEYFVPRDFLRAHATYEPRAEYYVVSYASDYVEPEDVKYNYLISPSNNSITQINAALSAEPHVGYSLRSKIYEEMQMFLETIQELEMIFLYIAIGVGGLAAFFLLNFISVSISAKKKDVGILRAVGARSSDVFKIFYAEAFLIALICFALASVGSYILCFFLDKSLRNIISIRLLHFGLPNVGLIFAISVAVSFIATFFPVFFAAKKSPVESIRAL